MHQSRYFGFLLSLLYIIGIHKGYIALWKSPKADPVQIFPVKASLLPAEDQHILEKGIEIEEDSELHNLLEDYLS